MEMNFTKGYARLVSSEDIQRRPSHYFLILEFQKMAGRPELQLVFYAAAKSHGK
jgi:hypothetical protein